MKKLTLLLAAFICSCFSITNAQTFTVKAGYNLADMKVGGSDGKDLNKPQSGFHAGAAVEFPINKSFSVEPGLLFSVKGSKGDLDFVDVEEKGVIKTNLNYIDIPVNFKFKKPVGQSAKIFVSAGPYLGIGLSGKFKWEVAGMTGTGFDGERDVTWGKEKDYKRVDYGASAGAGAEIGRLQFSLSYDYGLGKILDFGSVYVNNRVLKISVGYRLGKSL